MLVLIIEDEQRIREGMVEMLRDEAYQVVDASNLNDGLELIIEESPDTILSDINLPDGDGFSVLDYCKTQGLDIPVIFMTAFGNREMAIQAINQGAYDYIAKPIRFDELFARLHRLREMQVFRDQVRRKAKRKQHEGELVVLGTSPAMMKVRKIAEKAMSSDAPLLITGETGTGKGLLAKLIHAGGKRREKPFVGINCASIPENLLESELFGFRKGAFTGADHHKKGLLEEAAEGTLFLDEIGDMPLQLQAKLLHVLDDGTFRPLGSTKDQKFSGRILSATNAAIEHVIQGNRFREDLFYRLSVLQIEIPPLRNRPDDLLPLAESLYRELVAEMGKADIALPPALATRIQQQQWPGNVRQLRNFLERALIMDEGPSADVDQNLSLADAVQGFEKAWINRVIETCGDDKAEAARRLGIGLSTLYRKLEG